MNDADSRNEPDSRARFDHDYIEMTLKAATEHFGTDVTDDQFTQLYTKALVPAVASASDVLRDALVANQPGMLRDHRRQDARFRRILRERWGTALDAMYATIVLAEEMGADHDRRFAKPAAEKKDLLFEALTRLHARSCRIAFEVHTLLSGGFAMGGLARCRTLHEIAVTASVLSKFSKTLEHADIAERYLLHDVVVSYHDAAQYQKNCAVLGYEPYSEKEIASMKTDNDAVLSRFGKLFGSPFGWAGAALNNPSPKFSHLEAAAGLSHLSSHHRWATRETHADAKGARMNVHETAELHFKASGPFDGGLADPGDIATLSLYQTTATVLLSYEAGPYDLMCVGVLDRFRESTAELFSSAQKVEND